MTAVAVEPQIELADTTSPVTERSPAFLSWAMPFVRIAAKGWHRSDVRGIENVPDGGALLISNHSGGIIAMDVPVLAVALFDRFGSEHPVHVLAHDMLFFGPLGSVMRRAGFLPANKKNAAAALSSGGTTILFPGGDREAYRPTSQRNRIDFNGRTGYVRAAIEAGVPLVPAVSIGGQENQLYLSRGEAIAKRMGMTKHVRSESWPVTLGFPFGISMVMPPNIPLPTKIVTQVLEPIDIVAEFGPDPDEREVDAVVRQRMQDALDELARQRRFPVLG